MLDAVDEIDALDDVGKVSKVAQFTPAFLGGLSEFEHHMKQALSAETSLGELCAVADYCGGAFCRIARADALPVERWEVVEGEQLPSILDQTLDGFRVFCFERGNEQIKAKMRLLTGLGLPDVVQHFPGLGLSSFGKIIQDIAGLVHPAVLLAGGVKNLLQSSPEPHGPVTCGQFLVGNTKRN